MGQAQTVVVSIGAPAPTDVVAVARGDARVVLSEESIATMDACRAVIDALASDVAGRDRDGEEPHRHHGREVERGDGALDIERFHLRLVG